MSFFLNNSIINFINTPFTRQDSNIQKRSQKMIICALFIVACFGNLFSECKNLYDKEIKFKPNQDAKIHIFVSLNL